MGVKHYSENDKVRIINQVRNLKMQGLKKSEIFEQVPIAPRTFDLWKQKHPELFSNSMILAKPKRKYTKRNLNFADIALEPKSNGQVAIVLCQVGQLKSLLKELGE